MVTQRPMLMDDGIQTKKFSDDIGRLLHTIVGANSE